MARTNEISNADDVIDSRDVIARIKELEDSIELDGDAADQEERDELDALNKLAKEGEDYAEDWTHVETLIRESYFTEYCQELVHDIGDMPKGMADYIVIDWDATARNLKHDYTEVDYDGIAYLIR